MSEFDFLNARLHSLAEAGRTRSLIPRDHQGIKLVMPDRRRLINFGSNDYLGFASDAIDSHRQTAASGSGSGASALVSGWTINHQRLADQIASFEGTDAAVLFPTGYAACCGTIATLAAPEDLILSDELNHASLIDGCRLTKATRIVYPHRDVAAVAAMLEQRRGEFDRVWIVTDGVFGMDGHVGPLDQLAELADRFDAHLIVDEAHGTGVLGATGQGAGEAMQVKSRVSVTIGTLSKAVGAQGGFVAASTPVIDYLVNRCRTLIFSTALAPMAVDAAMSALRLIADDAHRKDHVQQLSRRLRSRLSIDVPEVESGVPIVPVIIGDDRRTVAASQRLADQGFYVPAIRPPTVPENTGRLRVSLSAAHDRSMVDALADAIAELQVPRATVLH